MDPWTECLRVCAHLVASFILVLSAWSFPLSRSVARDPSEVRSIRQDASVEDTGRPLDATLRYISGAWDQLTRSASDCRAFSDTKTDGEPVLYLPADLAFPPALNELQKRCSVRVERLPEKITTLGSPGLHVPTEGLLYLENPYVVPGGQFNEMYGWDSYFIILGLLREHRLALAKGMVENFFFEIAHYGGVLNANRTYYLTRSQPPFLSSMILAVYDAEKANGKTDTEWLKNAYQFAAQDYEQWNQPPHVAGETGLSRYFDHGDGPVPEIQGDPSHYYREVAQFFLLHGNQDNNYLIPLQAGKSTKTAEPLYSVFVCNSSVTAPNPSDCLAATIGLTAEFYKGDRSMRESGFDVSFRFGPFGADTHHYAPVCLNSLLFKTEMDLGRMSALLGRRRDALRWRRRALNRRKRINLFLWNERRGLYFDYDFVRQKQSSYEYATTFYPLWAGLASARQARLVDHNLSLFEQAGGLAMSRRETGAQWDYPYGWAPIQLLAVEGLRRYGYRVDANRIAGKFLSTVLRNYLLDHTIREKYDVVKGSESTPVNFGYAQNMVGFGWTNGVFLELLSSVPSKLRVQLNRETAQ